MSAPLIPFAYGDHSVRVVTIDGEPWFVLADLCRVLDLSNPTMVADRLDADALSTAEVIDSMGRTQQATIVSEPGMYAVVFMSRKPEAVAFRRWIRKHGGYLTPAAIEQTLTDPDFIIRLATQLRDDPIDVAAKALAAAGYFTGRNRLFDELGDLGWAYKDWHPYQQHGPEGTKRLTVRVHYYDRSASSGLSVAGNPGDRRPRAVVH